MAETPELMAERAASWPAVEESRMQSVRHKLQERGVGKGSERGGTRRSAPPRVAPAMADAPGAPGMRVCAMNPTSRTTGVSGSARVSAE